MLGNPTQILEFDPDDLSELRTRALEVAVAGAGGWINLQPAVDEESLPPPTGTFGRLFSAKGRTIPLATWVPGVAGSRGVEPTSLGIQHGFGRQAAPRLREVGLWPHEGWVQVGDNAKRGFVANARPVDGGMTLDAVDEQLDWLVTASLVLTVVPVPRAWRAAFFG